MNSVRRVDMLVVILLLFLGSTQATWNVNCDFDLEGIEKIVQYLPKECQEIYRSGPSSELYQASLKESRKFAEFFTKLEQHEQKGNSNENAKPNFELRYEIYNATKLDTCVVDVGNRTDLPTDSEKMTEYYNCLAEKRNQMIEILDAK